jgi:hypothetical protein
VHGAAPVPDELLDTLVRRRQQIGQVEIIGAIVPYLSVPKLLAGRDVLHWIDNTSALSALTKGYSGVPDSARLVHMFHAWNVGAKAAVWFEYVPSKPNPADEPSRELELAGAEWRPAPDVVSLGVSQTFSHFFSKVAGAGRNRNCRNISRNLPVVSGAGRFDVGPRAGFGQVLAFWPVLASFASNNFRVVAIS